MNNKKLHSDNVAELDRYYAPNGYVVKKLPDKRSVREMTEVFIKNQSGAYDVYQMIAGEWVLTNSNLNTVEKTVVSTSGGSGYDYSSTISDHETRITTNEADIDALEARVHDYTKQTSDYTLPSAAGIENYILSVKNTGNSEIVVDCAGAETIDDETEQYLSPGDCMTVMSDNTNWIIV